MNQLIADSGATKTEWCLTGGEERRLLKTEGLNPYYHDAESIREVVEREVLPRLAGRGVERIHFYGAGCDGPRKKELVARALEPLFPHSGIDVYHDLLGAARACFLGEAGIACIIGTGSNTCLYDGQRITEHIPSLAFILGDEGSAAWFGRKLINDYFRFEIPPDLREDLEERHDMSLGHITCGTYEGRQKSRFVASYAAFLGNHREHPYVKALLREGFENLVDRIILKYSGAPEREVRFVGSVAWSYRELLTEILRERGVTVGLFIRNPMERLVRFHSGPGEGGEPKESPAE